MRHIPEAITWVTGFVAAVCVTVYFSSNKTFGIWSLFSGIVFAVLTGFMLWQNDIWKVPKDKNININTLIDSKSNAKLPELQKLFPGGFEIFGVLTGASATAGHTIIRSSTSYNIDITWDNASITELNPSAMTLQLKNIRILRSETTPTGTKPAGAININGAAVWQIDRGAKLVYINNAISFWGYVLGGFVISDRDDVLIVAIGLQKI